MNEKSLFKDMFPMSENFEDMYEHNIIPKVWRMMTTATEPPKRLSDEDLMKEVMKRGLAKCMKAYNKSLK